MKIGRSRNPQRRLAHLQIGSPARLSLLAQFEGGASLERALHRHLHDQREHGEWFSLGPDPVETVRAAIRDISKASPTEELPAERTPTTPTMLQRCDRTGRPLVYTVLERSPF
ncbi:GIY-YIG nuclease family protein [Streptomyces sp. NPDC014735]|uniref:GIY-YIG nuclease family protein n=1 Tax=Streptomyces sp. NPDC014735 TaxID=3364887 RepID=UPI0036FFAA4B